MSNKKWAIKVAIISFILSIILSFISSNALDKISLIPAIIILLVVVAVGTIFDTIAMAVTVAKEHEFHSMASNKVPGSKKAIKIIRKSSEVSNFCADVIGDICGVLSGTICAVVALKLKEQFNLQFNIEFLVTAFIASLTVTTKALDKEIAKKHSTKIVGALAKIIDRKK